MLKLEAVGFVGFVVESIQLVDGKLVELIEVRPSFSALIFVTKCIFQTLNLLFMHIVSWMQVVKKF